MVGTRHGNRRVANSLYRVDHVLGHLFEHAVVDPVFGIKPPTWSQNCIGAERSEQVGRYHTLIDTKLNCLGPVNVYLNRRIIENLLDTQVSKARNGSQRGFKPACDVVVVIKAVTGNLDVNRRRQAEAEDLTDNVGSLEIDFNVRILSRDRLADLLPITCGRMVLWLERDRHIGVLRTDAVVLVEGQ